VKTGGFTASDALWALSLAGPTELPPSPSPNGTHRRRCRARACIGSAGATESRLAARNSMTPRWPGGGGRKSLLRTPQRPLVGRICGSLSIGKILGDVVRIARKHPSQRQSGDGFPDTGLLTVVGDGRHRRIATPAHRSTSAFRQLRFFAHPSELDAVKLDQVDARVSSHRVDHVQQPQLFW
jgi:hypothetical protein